MKKIILLPMLTLSILLISLSCKKTSTAPNTPSYIGFWVGKYGSSTSYPTSGYSFLFTSGGVVHVYDGADTATAAKGVGTYTVTGLTVNTTYIYTGGETYSTTATLNTENSFQEGTWGSGTNTTNGGRFFIVKQ